jgi:uncharacterized protein (TIGR02145 family)
MSSAITDQIVLCYVRQDANDVQPTCHAISKALPRLSISMLEVADDPTVVHASFQAYEQSRFVVVFLSKRFEAVSTDLTLGRALKAGTMTFPVRLDECSVPESLTELQWFDLFEDGSLEQLVQSIKDEFHTFVDSRDGQKYRTVDIGEKTWLAENLNYDVDGSWWYEDESRNGEEFGRLYTWETARLACPEGWHIADVVEWQELAESVGGSWLSIGGGPKGDGSTASYEKLIVGGASGFDALLGGTRDSRFNAFFDKMQVGYYWGQSDDGSEVYTYAFSARMGGRIVRFQVTDEADRENAISCRCVRN